MRTPLFQRYIGIDYSGAQTPDSSLKGLRVYAGSQAFPPIEIQPPPSPKKYWTRRGIAEWLGDILAKNSPTIVGIDHAFSFPEAYFAAHQLKRSWQDFLEDFHQHWPTDDPYIYVDFARNSLRGVEQQRTGNSRWRRLTDIRAKAKSVFHFDVPGSVAKSTHAGLPWLLSLRRQLGEQLHFWPFDGWKTPQNRSVITEIYPALWSKNYPRDNRTQDQQDAFAGAAWLRDRDLEGRLREFLTPPLSETERNIAAYEGWILGLL